MHLKVHTFIRWSSHYQKQKWKSSLFRERKKWHLKTLTGRGRGVSGIKFLSYYHMDGACTAANLWVFHPTKPLSDTRETTALPNCTIEIRSGYSKSQSLQFPALVKNLSLTAHILSELSLVWGNRFCFHCQDRFLNSAIAKARKRRVTVHVTLQKDPGRILNLCYRELCFLTEVITVNKTRQK